MSVAVEVSDLPAVLADLDGAAFVCSTGPHGRPKVVHAPVAFIDDQLTATVGRGTVANVAAGSPVTLVFPGPSPLDLSLLVDADARTDGGDDQAITMTATGAVWHRSAHGASS